MITPVHEVWAIPPDDTDREMIGICDIERWQWAEKLRSRLKQQGYREIGIQDSTMDTAEED